MIGWFSAAVIGAFRSSLFRCVVPSAVRCRTVLPLLCFLIAWASMLPEFQGHPTNLFLTLSVPQRNLAGWQKYRCFDELAGKFCY